MSDKIINGSVKVVEDIEAPHFKASNVEDTYFGNDGLWLAGELVVNDAGQITSQNANAGDVLTADGSGGSSWESPFPVGSFSELDPVLKQLIEDSVTTHDGVACSQEQWTIIKNLLDKSFYLNYNGYSLIKSYFNKSSNEYYFGSLSVNYGEELRIFFDVSTNLLYADYGEV